MILTDRRASWARLVFQMRGTVLSHIWGRLALTFLVAVAVTVVHLQKPLAYGLTLTPFSLVGLALSIILGFRNQTCYQRFWEGRQLWGALVNVSRSAARQTLTLIHARDPRDTGEVLALQRAIVHGLCAFAHLLRIHLRDLKDAGSLVRLLPEDDVRRLARSHNAPNALVTWVGEKVAEAGRRGWVEPTHMLTLQDSLSDLTDVQGGCERIKNTPIPFAYTLLIHRIAGLYCLTLPLGIVTTTGPYTPIVAMFVAYAFFGLDAVGDEIEDPFGMDAHDLPLDQLSTMIEINLRESLGESPLPAPVRPKDGVLT